MPFLQVDFKLDQMPCTYLQQLSFLGKSSLRFLRRPGQIVVNRSIEIGHPIIYVSMNYRCVCGVSDLFKLRKHTQAAP